MRPSNSLSFRERVHHATRPSMAQPGVGKWTREEHQRYLQAIKVYPQGPWQSVANFVGTRSARQTQTHAQKHREKLSRRKRGLLRKRAMSDEWTENNPPTPLCDERTQAVGLPAPSQHTTAPAPHKQPYYDMNPPRLPALEQNYMPLPSYPNHSHHNAPKGYSPSYHQAPVNYPPSYHTQHAPTGYHDQRVAPLYAEAHHHGRVAPPLDELLQFFVDDVELMAHHHHRTANDVRIKYEYN